MKDILEKGEKIIWEGRPNKKSYLIGRLLPIVLILLVFGTFFFFAISIFLRTDSTTSDITSLNLKVSDLAKNPKKVESQFSKIYNNYKKNHENELKEIEAAKTKEDAEHNEKLATLNEEHKLNILKIQSKHFKNIFKKSNDYSNKSYQNDLAIENTKYENEVKFENDRYNSKITLLREKYGIISDIVSYINDDGSVDIGSLSNDSFNNMIENYGTVSGMGFNIFSIFKVIALLPFIFIMISFISIIVSTIIQSKNLYYAVTDRRLIIQHGIIGLDYRSFEYTKIDDIYVKVGLIDKLFNTGSISLIAEYGLNNAGSHNFHRLMGESNSLLAIDKPYEVFKKIQRISKDLRTDVYYPNDLRPKTNKGYKTKYKK